MNQKTLTALWASIKHWEKNAAAVYPEGASTRGEDCALCGMFFNQGPDVPDCLGCPVAKKTGKMVCDGSPYHDAFMALRRWKNVPSDETQKQWGQAARAEVRFLRSLLP